MALCIYHSQAEPCPNCMSIFYQAGKLLAGSEGGFQIFKLNTGVPAALGVYIDSARSGYNDGLEQSGRYKEILDRFKPKPYEPPFDPHNPSILKDDDWKP